MDLAPFIKNNMLTVRVIPNAQQTKIKSTEKNIIKLAIAAPAQDNKANKELIRFFKKELKISVRIKSGEKSRKKILELIQP